MADPIETQSTNAKTVELKHGFVGMVERYDKQYFLFLKRQKQISKLRQLRHSLHAKNCILA
jgi:hypothetical protein